METVSLILTTYNCADHLRGTLRSIDEQDYPDIEVVIKDGASTDETLAVIEEYEKNGKYKTVWKSERDGGIYDAMNQGYQMSHGGIVGIFNERYLVPDAVSKLVMAMEKRDDDGRPYVGVHANLDYMDGDKVIRKWRMGEGSIRQGWIPGHPTLLLRREIYEKYGLYDTSYKISADYEFEARFLKDRENRLAFVPEVLVGMYYGGTSTVGLKSYLDSLKEGHRALKSNGYKFAFFIDMKRTLKVLWQFRK